MVRVICTMIVALALAGCGLSTNQLRVAYHVTNVADTGATVYGLEHGCREGNPLAASMGTGGVIALGAASSGLAELVCGNAGDQEKVCWTAFLGVKLLAAGWNAGQLARGCN